VSRFKTSKRNGFLKTLMMEPRTVSRLRIDFPDVRGVIVSGIVHAVNLKRRQSRSSPLSNFSINGCCEIP